MIIASMEDPYTFEQLKEPRLNVLVVKPLVDLLYDEDDVSLGMLWSAIVAIALTLQLPLGSSH
jgi:hypothetical protein